LRQIDDLVSATSELFRQSNQAIMSQVLPEDAESVRPLTRNLRARFVELEERLIRLRLVPAGDIMERAASRAGRIAARHLGKQVEFTITGGDVGIEKSLAEIIADPLLHLVRNAITHGIEDPATREAAGKNPTGCITLAASSHSGRIHIYVTDDGCGIDVERVMAAATRHGISSAGLSLDQCLRLIFRPGFSTATEVSDLSGRGIGLDIVDRAMDVAGGEVRVATESGKGTTFAMIIPTALSMVRCVLIRSGEHVYAIDAACLSDYDPAEGVATSSDNGFDQFTVPLLDLEHLLGQGDHKRGNQTTLMMWQPLHQLSSNNGAGRYCIAFDEVVGTQETLVRSLGRHSARWPGICGAAELLDGSVALVLDLEELIKDAIEKAG
jgi:two-component system chemotaxis sensor kinase CheA